MDGCSISCLALFLLDRYPSKIRLWLLGFIGSKASSMAAKVRLLAHILQKKAGLRGCFEPGSSMNININAVPPPAPRPRPTRKPQQMMCFCFLGMKSGHGKFSQRNLWALSS